MSDTFLAGTKTDNILLFSEGISYGHIIRSLIIARWLRELDRNIVVACTEASTSLFAAEGFATDIIDIANPKDIYQRLRQGGAIYTSEELLRYFRQDDSLIQKYQPRLIISEFRFTAPQLAKKYGIPVVRIADATNHPNFKPLGTVPDPFAKPEFLPLWLLDFISQKTPIGSKINEETIKTISLSLRESSISYGLEPLANFFEYATLGEICLLADHPDLIEIDNLRQGDIFTGALLWERPESLPAEIEKLSRDSRYLVYISLGTQDSLPTDFLERYVKKLLDLNIGIVVSRGKRNFNLHIEHSNLLVFDFINETKLFASVKVDLLVYPGGTMTTYHALAYGVPLLTLPAHANQHFYGEAIQKNQLGYFFRPSRVRIDTLVEATMDILNNATIKENTRLFQDKLMVFDNRSEIMNKIKKLLE
jgi:UDP:flavonoid glycosyltransferase YjiC (YdhE family)